MNHALQRCLAGVALGLSALMVGGCNGGSSPVIVPGTNLFALTDDNRLITIDSNRPNVATATRNITGLAAGDTLVAIDFRTSPGASEGGTTGLYGLSARAGGVHQLYRLNTGGAAVTATAVGVPFTLTPQATAVGFDFNPNVTLADGTRGDRIRLVTSDGRNLRVNPNTGAIVDSDPVNAGIQFDGNLAYAVGDPRNGIAPSIVGAAYTNNDLDAATGTVNYAIDSNGFLATQGRPDNPATPANEAVSPNTGQLFTVGNLGLTTGAALGFEITGNGNSAFAAFAPPGNVARLVSINLTNGVTTNLGTIAAPAGTNIVGLAATA